MRNGRFIIGVMGPTRGVKRAKKADLELLELAEAIGESIATQEHIILTGGSPGRKDSQSVKDAALFGACKVEGARLISVSKSDHFAIDRSDQASYRHLVVHTQLGDARNFVNGYLPDAVIAAGAGAGTFTEVAIAHASGVPIVCMQMKEERDTIPALRSAPATTSTEEGYADLLKFIHEAFPCFDPKRVAADLLIHLGTLPVVAEAATAVDLAIELAKQRPVQARNALPYHPGFAGCYDQYENDLTSL
jgi:predicted Rossmann-fold nucleotide-binding protein